MQKYRIVSGPNSALPLYVSASGWTAEIREAIVYEARLDTEHAKIAFVRAMLPVGMAAPSIRVVPA